jgi:hypothetical protein
MALFALLPGHEMMSDRANPRPLASKRADITIWLLRVPADGIGTAHYA